MVGYSHLGAIVLICSRSAVMLGLALASKVLIELHLIHLTLLALQVVEVSTI